VEELGKSGFDYTEEFEFGLDFILDGLERLKRQIRSDGEHGERCADGSAAGERARKVGIDGDPAGNATSPLGRKA
jgi:hypothetical protein